MVTAIGRMVFQMHCPALKSDKGKKKNAHHIPYSASALNRMCSERVFFVFARANYATRSALWVRSGESSSFGGATCASTQRFDRGECDIATDGASIVCDARPFLPSWSSFWLATLFLPWFGDAYWIQFVCHPRFARYGTELALLLLAVFFTVEFDFLTMRHP